MDKLYCKFDVFAKLDCKLDGLAKLRMSSMSCISCTVKIVSEYDPEIPQSQTADCKFDELVKLRMSSMSWISWTVSSMSWIS